MADKEKKILSRIINKHGKQEDWEKAVNFIPKQAEMIVYDIDDNYDYERIKIGDGVTSVSNLPFLIDRVSIINQNSSDDKIPSSKAVYDFVDTKTKMKLQFQGSYDYMSIIYNGLKNGTGNFYQYTGEDTEYSYYIEWSGSEASNLLGSQIYNFETTSNNDYINFPCCSLITGLLYVGCTISFTIDGYTYTGQVTNIDNDVYVETNIPTSSFHLTTNADNYWYYDISSEQFTLFKIEQIINVNNGDLLISESVGIPLGKYKITNLVSQGSKMNKNIIEIDSLDNLDNSHIYKYIGESTFIEYGKEPYKTLVTNDIYDISYSYPTMTFYAIDSTVTTDFKVGDLVTIYFNGPNLAGNGYGSYTGVIESFDIYTFTITIKTQDLSGSIDPTDPLNIYNIELKRNINKKVHINTNDCIYKDKEGYINILSDNGVNNLNYLGEVKNINDIPLNPCDNDIIFIQSTTEGFMSQEDKTISISEGYASVHNISDSDEKMFLLSNCNELYGNLDVGDLVYVNKDNANNSSPDFKVEEVQEDVASLTCSCFGKVISSSYTAGSGNHPVNIVTVRKNYYFENNTYYLYKNKKWIKFIESIDNISKDKLSSGVQESLDKADTAIQNISRSSTFGSILVDGVDVEINGMENTFNFIGDVYHGETIPSNPKENDIIFIKQIPDGPDVIEIPKAITLELSSATVGVHGGDGNLYLDNCNELYGYVDLGDYIFVNKDNAENSPPDFVVEDIYESPSTLECHCSGRIISTIYNDNGHSAYMATISKYYKFEVNTYYMYTGKKWIKFIESPENYDNRFISSKYEDAPQSYMGGYNSYYINQLENTLIEKIGKSGNFKGIISDSNYMNINPADPKMGDMYIASISLLSKFGNYFDFSFSCLPELGPSFITVSSDGTMLTIDTGICYYDYYLQYLLNMLNDYRNEGRTTYLKINNNTYYVIYEISGDNIIFNKILGDNFPSDAGNYMTSATITLYPPYSNVETGDIIFYNGYGWDCIVFPKIDNELNSESNNAISNAVISEELNKKFDNIIEFTSIDELSDESIWYRYIGNDVVHILKPAIYSSEDIVSTSCSVTTINPGVFITIKSPVVTKFIQEGDGITVDIVEVQSPSNSIGNYTGRVTLVKPETNVFKIEVTSVNFSSSINFKDVLISSISDIIYNTPYFTIAPGDVIKIENIIANSISYITPKTYLIKNTIDDFDSNSSHPVKASVLHDAITNVSVSLNNLYSEVLNMSEMLYSSMIPTVLTSISDNTIILEDRQIVRLGEYDSLTLLMPEGDLMETYYSEFSFISGEIATNLIYTDTPIIWAGDDVDADGVFIPESNTFYEVSIKKLGEAGIYARVGGTSL